jgi:TatD DNase family protein
MHCFGGDEEEALEFARLGLYIGLGGPVTFKNAARAREVARRVPLGQLILETDCPFLSPHPYRGQRNEPSRLGLIAREIALIRGLSVEEVDRVTSKNARRLFRLPEPTR